MAYLGAPQENNDSLTKHEKVIFEFLKIETLSKKL